MITGRVGGITAGAYVEGILILPTLNSWAPVSFLIDTGADTLTLMPTDAQLIGLNYGELRDSRSALGVGGVTQIFTLPAVVGLEIEGEGIHCFEIELSIAPFAPGMEQAPSLLGRDVIGKCKLTCNIPKDEVTIEVQESDYVLPPGARVQ